MTPIAEAFPWMVIIYINKGFTLKLKVLLTSLTLGTKDLISKIKVLPLSFVNCFSSFPVWYWEWRWKGMLNLVYFLEINRWIRQMCLHPCCYPIKITWWFLWVVTIALLVHTPMHTVKVDRTSIQVFWLCEVWKNMAKNQIKIITKFCYS